MLTAGARRRHRIPRASSAATLCSTAPPLHRSQPLGRSQTESLKPMLNQTPMKTMLNHLNGAQPGYHRSPIHIYCVVLLFFFAPGA